MKKVGDITVNNGGGLYDNEGICETLLNDLNNLTRLLFVGNGVQFCALVTSMAQKLSNLKKGISADMQSMKDNIEELKRTNERLVEQINGIPAEKDGGQDGES